jgi:serine/threonine-protein kinase
MVEDPLAGRRFLAEARAATAIRHPSIVDISDYGLLADGRPYIVMERLDGESLQDRLDRTRFLAPTSALLLAREIAWALGAAHDGGVVHLDLKPSNVILLEGFDEAEPKIKLIDFGVAARAGTTTDGDVSGTPEYMSPEQVRGEPADQRNDLYALGVVLYEMLSGQVPFESMNVWNVLRQHLVDEPPPVTSPVSQLPEAVVRVVKRALRKNPDERHQSASELVGEIDAALSALERKEWLKWLP